MLKSSRVTGFWVLLLLITNPFLPVFQHDGNVLLEDDFSTRSNRWSLEKTAKLSVEYRDEQLQMKIISPGIAVWSTPDTDLRLNHYNLIVSAQVLSSSPQSAVGVVFNYQDSDNYYLLEAQPEGSYAVRLVKRGHLVEGALAEGQLDAADSFVFEISIYAGEFTFAINDVALPPIKDNTFRQGKFGLYARAGLGALRVAFDDLRVLDIPAND